MQKELIGIHDFVKSLELSELNGEQQSLLLVGEEQDYYGGDNGECKGTNGTCSNTECQRSTNTNCSNTDCNSSSNRNCTCNTGATSSSSMIGFPGF